MNAIRADQKIRKSDDQTMECRSPTEGGQLLGPLRHTLRLEPNGPKTKMPPRREAFERETGLEPATPTLARSCSTN